jgi:L-asparaginase II
MDLDRMPSGSTVNSVEVVRGGVVEARHAVHFVVVDADGQRVCASGPTDEATFYRSAAKPLQALPLVEEGVVDRFGLTEAELALCCASHESEAVHVDGARSILAKAGADEGLLRCGPHLPKSEAALSALLASGGRALPIHNNCSGKHAGMIALALAMGWDPEDYHLPEHPVQRRMMREIVRWSGLEEGEVLTGVDGCGVVCFALPLEAMAASFARFAAAAERGEGPGRIVRAMTSHPYMVGGAGRCCTEVMAVGGGRLFVKVGAEGLYCGGVPERGWGFALKITDGGRRAVEVALVRLLAGLGVIDEDGAEALRRHVNPPVENTRGEVVGEIRPAFEVRIEA